jgi:hypothetical protein
MAGPFDDLRAALDRDIARLTEAESACLKLRVAVRLKSDIGAFATALGRRADLLSQSEFRRTLLALRRIRRMS